jgi:hypothetical protein
LVSHLRCETDIRDDNSRAEFVWDTTGQFAYQEQATVFNPAGQVAEQDTLYDNQSLTTAFYDPANASLAQEAARRSRKRHYCRGGFSRGVRYAAYLQTSFTRVKVRSDIRTRRDARISCV